MLHHTPSVTVAAMGPFVLGRWREVPDVVGLQAMHASLRGWAAEAGAFVAVNTVDANSMIQLTQPARREVAKIQESFDRQQVGLAMVIPARGFFSAAVRGMVEAVGLMSRARFPQAVFVGPDEAITWGLEKLSLPHDVEAARAYLAALASLEEAPVVNEHP